MKINLLKPKKTFKGSNQKLVNWTDPKPKKTKKIGGIIRVCEPTLGVEEKRNLIDCIDTGWMDSEDAIYTSAKMNSKNEFPLTTASHDKSKKSSTTRWRESSMFGVGSPSSSNCSPTKEALRNGSLKLQRRKISIWTTSLADRCKILFFPGCTTERKSPSN